MRRLQFRGLALALGIWAIPLSCPPAQAVDAGYVEFWGGISQVSEGEASATTSAGGTGTGDIEFDLGYEGRIAAGFEDRSMRFEFELGYELHSPATITSSGSSADLDADISLLTFGGNIYYDIELFGEIVPYFGGGVGITPIFVDEITATVGGASTTVSDVEGETFLSYRLMAGLSYEVADRWTVGAEYRFTISNDIELSDDSGNSVEFERMSHAFALGLRWRYWTPDGFGL